jgi:hypothetical protein
MTEKFVTGKRVMYFCKECKSIFWHMAGQTTKIEDCAKCDARDSFVRVDESVADELADARGEIARLRLLVAELKEGISKISDKWVEDGEDGGFQCIYCGSKAEPFRSLTEEDTPENHGWNCDHDDTCEIELLRSLMSNVDEVCPTKCEECGGSGIVHWAYDDQNIGATCDAEGTCPSCHGTGKEVTGN